MAVASADTTPAGVTPSLAETRALAADYNVIPVRETFIDDCQTPVSAFLKLRESGPSFLLESADQGRVGRYSFIGIRPRKVLRWSLGDPGDPYRLTHAELSRVNAAPLPELPPFAGGAATWRRPTGRRPRRSPRSVGGWPGRCRGRRSRRAPGASCALSSPT